MHKILGTVIGHGVDTHTIPSTLIGLVARKFPNWLSGKAGSVHRIPRISSLLCRPESHVMAYENISKVELEPV